MTLLTALFGISVLTLSCRAQLPLEASDSAGGGRAFNVHQPTAAINYGIVFTGVTDLVGTIVATAGIDSGDTASALLADGRELSISSFSLLFSVLGTTFGGDGRTTFALPDLRGRVPRCAGDGPGLDAVSLGQRGGDDTHALTVNEMPSHAHNDPDGDAMSATGGNTAADFKQPWLGVNCMIALQGTFPSRSRSIGAGEAAIAEIRYTAHNVAPRGWALCEGQLLPIGSNSALFSLLGTTFGGDGRTTFGLPEARGRFLVHPGNGPGLSSVRLGQRGGSSTTTLATNQLPRHTHSVQGSPSTTTGGGLPVSLLAPFIAVHHVVALVGLFPGAADSINIALDEATLAQIAMFGGNFAPRGWALADGQELAISSNSELFSLLGTVYGGDGRTSFDLPDLRGRVTMRRTGTRALGARFGAETITLTELNLPAHTHDFCPGDVIADVCTPTPCAQSTAACGPDVYSVTVTRGGVTSSLCFDFGTPPPTDGECTLQLSATSADFGASNEALFSRTYPTCEFTFDGDDLSAFNLADGGVEIDFVQCAVLTFDDGSTRKRAPVFGGAAAASAGTFSVLAAGASGDPHIRGAYGQRFDFYGRSNEIYTLFSAPQFVVNMQLLAQGPKDKYIQAAFVHFRNVTLRFDTGAYKVDKMQQRINHQLARVNDVDVVVGAAMTTIDLCQGHRVEIVQRVDTDRINHKPRKYYHLDVKIDVPGCHDDFGGILGETYRCNGQFKWDRSREEEFHVKFGHDVSRDSKFSPHAPCHDNAKEFSSGHSISGNTGKHNM